MICSLDVKVCTNCKLKLPISEFTKSKESKDGFRYQCKKCNYVYTLKGDRNKWNQSYYYKHKKENPEKYIYKQAKHRAKVNYKDMEFTIKVSDIVIPKQCPYLGVELSFFKEGNQAPSLDRIDSSKGYTKDNIQVISRLANTMKNNATKEQLIAFAKGVIAMNSKEVGLL